MVDDAAGTAIAVRHLWQRGRHRIGLLAGPTISHSSQRRIQGYKKALAELGSAVEPGLIRYCRPTAAGGQQGALVLLAAHPDLTGLVGYNDLVAAGALKACQQQGRRVPQDLAIVGWDDIYIATLTSPELTTLRVSGRALGQEAMRLLLRQLDSANTGSYVRQIMLQPTLVVRGSTP